MTPEVWDELCHLREDRQKMLAPWPLKSPVYVAMGFRWEGLLAGAAFARCSRLSVGSSLFAPNHLVAFAPRMKIGNATGVNRSTANSSQLKDQLLDIRTRSAALGSGCEGGGGGRGSCFAGNRT